MLTSPATAARRLAHLRAGVVARLAAALVAVPACAGPRAPAPSAPAPSAADAPGASTVDRRIQRLADEEVDRALTEWQPAAATILVVDPATGEILANAGRAHGVASDVATQRAYVTGSTFKPLLLAAALEEGVVTPADRIDCENGAHAYGDLVLRDTGAYGTLTVPELVAVSSNIGFAKVFERLGGERLGLWLRRFHFGVAPPLAGAGAGEVPERIADGSFEGAAVAIGEGKMTVTQLQLIAVYAALAAEGNYHAPTRTRGPRTAGERLFTPGTARAVLAMLEGAVGGERATGKAARIPGVRVAGKTGSADWLPDGSAGVYTSFVGIVPADHPRFVILVGLESPRGFVSGGKVAPPIFARVAARALAD